METQVQVVTQMVRVPQLQMVQIRVLLLRLVIMEGMEQPESPVVEVAAADHLQEQVRMGIMVQQPMQMAGLLRQEVVLVVMASQVQGMKVMEIQQLKSEVVEVEP